MSTEFLNVDFNYMDRKICLKSGCPFLDCDYDEDGRVIYYCLNSGKKNCNYKNQ